MSAASAAQSFTEERLAQVVPPDARFVAVEFSAEWCGPCRVMGPVVEEVAKEFGPALRLVLVDADAQQDVTAHFNVRTLPTTLLFRDRELVDRVVGAVRRDTFRERVAAVIEGRK